MPTLLISLYGPGVTPHTIEEGKKIFKGQQPVERIKPANLTYKTFPRAINCMKHNPDSPFLHGPGFSNPYSSSSGYKLELFGYPDFTKDELFAKPRKPLSEEEKKQLDELIKTLKLKKD